jgi:hypothetical protein
MLKLSGWSRPTWGPKRERPPKRRSRVREIRRATRRAHDRVRGSLNHRSSWRPPPGLDFGPTASGSAREASIRPRPPRLGEAWGRRSATPRRTCPRPAGLGRNLRSKTRWFTGFCNSHQVSHFATFFIDARAEISVAESRSFIFARSERSRAPRPVPGPMGRALLFPWVLGASGAGVLFVSRGEGPRGPAPRGWPRGEGREPPAAPACVSRELVRGSFCGAGFDNDPSAGSPTETLLRLLLPLNDKVQWTSRDVAGGEPPTSPRSEHFTGPFNR